MPSFNDSSTAFNASGVGFNEGTLVSTPPDPLSVEMFGIQIAVEIAFEDNGFTLDDPVKGILDTSRLKPDWVWTDVTEFVMGIQTETGRTRNLERFSAGTATVTINDTVDRRFDPKNFSGAYYPNIVPGKPIRIRAKYATETYDLWFGYIDAYDISYTTAPAGEGMTTVEIRATDGFKLLAAFKAAASPRQGASELTGARIHRLLAHADWPGTLSDVDPGTTTLIPTTLEDPALDEMTAVMFSEGGLLYQDGAGKIIFEDRDAATVNERSRSSQATFGENEIRYHDVAIAYDDELIKNDVTLETTPGLTVRRQDSTSQALYGAKTFDITGLWNSNVGALGGLADLILALSKDAELRVESLTLVPQRSPSTMWPQALGRRIHDRVTVVRRPPGGGSLSTEVFIEGIKHRAEANGIWETEFAFSSGNTLVFSPNNFILDDPIYGVLDSIGVLAF